MSPIVIPNYVVQQVACDAQCDPRLVRSVLKGESPERLTRARFRVIEALRVRGILVEPIHPQIRAIAHLAKIGEA